MIRRASAGCPYKGRVRTVSLKRSAVLLILDVFPYRRLVESDGAHIVAAGPKRSVLSDAAPPFGMAIAQHKGAFALEIPHHLGHGVLGWDPYADVYVVCAYASAHHLASGLALHELSYYPTYFRAAFSIQDLASVLGYPHYVVDAFPSRVQ